MTQKTALHDDHVAMGARMVPFAGWDMPVVYSSIIEEHTATRTSAGLFDVSHMTEFRLRGSGCSSFLRRMVPTRLDRVQPGKSIYSVLCNEAGGVVDDLFIYMIDDREYFLVANAGTHEKDLDWLRSHDQADVAIIDESDFTAKIDLQGPRSREILARVIPGQGAENLERFSFGTFSFGTVPVMISQSGYTGETGFELYLHNDHAPALWKSLLEQGAGLGLRPAGLGARDTLRLEACLSLYGHELSDTITPVEAGLKWLISSTDDYIGRNVLERQLHDGAPRSMIAFEVEGRGVPRDGYGVMAGDERLGTVTSGTFSPSFQKGIGLALVDRGRLNSGDQFTIEVRGKALPARAVKRPIYAYNAR